MNMTTLGEYMPLVLQGLVSTISITLLSLALGTLLGGCVYAMGQNRRRWVREVARWWRYIVRGTPLMMLILFIFFVVFSGGNGFLAAVLAFAVNFSNFACSVFQSSFEAVGRGQVEAAKALGLTPMQTLRHVVVPQAWHYAMGPFKFQATSLLKGTAVVGYASIPDLTQAVQAIRTGTGEMLLPLLAATAVYFMLAWLLNKLLDQTLKIADRK